MSIFSIRKTAAVSVALAALFSLAVTQPVYAQAKASKAQQIQDKMMAGLPRCSAKLGTISVVNGDDASGWTNNSLAAPQKLLKVIVQKSGCFSLVDRGAGMDAAAREREIGGSLGLQQGSNMGKGQIKAADFVLVALLIFVPSLALWLPSVLY